MDDCSVCNKPASTWCGRCKAKSYIRYCSVDCQKADWTVHKLLCTPLKHLQSEQEYTEAIKGFTTYIEANTVLHRIKNNVNNYIAIYGRGMCYNKMGQYIKGCTDGDNCIGMEHTRQAGYKCKGDALFGMGRIKEALDVFLDGNKACGNNLRNSGSFFYPEIKRLNEKHREMFGKEYIGDLDISWRKRNEIYCVVCDSFEIDDKNAKYIPCNRCNQVNYCKAAHKENDGKAHTKVCDQLQFQFQLENAFVFNFTVIYFSQRGSWLCLNFKGDAGKEFIESQKNTTDNVQIRVLLNELSTNGSVNLLPVTELSILNGMLTKEERNSLKSWRNWFSMPREIELFANIIKSAIPIITKFSEFNGDCSTPVDESMMMKSLHACMTDTYSNAFTIFRAVVSSGKLDENTDKALNFHIVGAEQNNECISYHRTKEMLTKLLGREVKIELIGPSLPADLDPREKIIMYKGFYHDYLKNNPEPDFAVAFFPGFYDPTYNWLPSLHSITRKKIPLIFTCCTNEDLGYTIELLCFGMKWTPAEFLGTDSDKDNIFASQFCYVEPRGSNKISRTNMYGLLYQAK